MEKFEDLFFDVLCDEHDRPDLFVKSKVDEINCRLRKFFSQASHSILTWNKESSQKKVVRLVARCNYEGKPVSPKKFSRLEVDIER